MAETRTPIISISTGEAVKNVAELKDNIKELKKQLDSVETSTEDYSDIVKQLSQNQAALRNVMNGVNSTFDDSIKAAQGLGTSYNSLVQQLKQATQEWRAIPKYLSDADQAAGKVNQAWTDAAKKVYDLRTELKSMDESTNSFVRNVGNYKSALDGFSGSMNTVRQVGGDMVNGLSAAASTLGLLGINTDGLDDSMKSLRIILAAVQGAKGFAGLIAKLGSYFKAGKQATQATVQQTAALGAETVAQTSANVATEAGTVAMGGLQKALIATGIGALVVALGALVAHFEDIVNWVAKLGEKWGLWKLQTDKAKEANEKLKNSLEKQNRAFEQQSKILSAQGVSNKTILLQKKELIKSQINETKAAIAAAEARIKQLEADHRWWKFWQGTKGKVEKELDNIKEWNESLKELTNSLEDVEVDIKVEGIKAGQAAAEKAKKDEEEALTLAKKIVDEGVKAANKELQAQETELQKINREHKETIDTLDKAIAKTKELTGYTNELDILEKGKEAAIENYNKARENYYKKGFEEQAQKYAEKISEETEIQYKAEVRYAKILKDVLGYTDQQVYGVGKATTEQKRQYEILKAQVEYLRNNIELTDDILGPLTGKTKTELVEEFGEPLATAIRLYFEKSDELDAAGIEMFKTIFSSFEDEVNKLISKGEFFGAKELINSFWDEFADEFKSMGAKRAFIQTIENEIQPALSEAIQESARFDIASWLSDPNLLANLPKLIKTYKDVLERDYNENIKPILDKYNVTNYLGEVEYTDFTNATDEEIKAIERYEDAILKLKALEEKLFNQRLKLFTDNTINVSKFFNSYGTATKNLLDNVADAWEAALQAQVKSGKKSEEEAQRSFETMKTLQYASAVISTAASVAQALADTTVPSFYVKAANAAASLAAGTAQIIKISQTEFSSSASNAGRETPVLVPSAPQVQYTVGVNEADYAAAQAQNPIRAYVVDKDIADGLDEYNQRVSETTF